MNEALSLCWETVEVIRIVVCILLHEYLNSVVILFSLVVFLLLTPFTHYSTVDIFNNKVNVSFDLFNLKTFIVCASTLYNIIDYFMEIIIRLCYLSIRFLY